MRPVLACLLLLALLVLASACGDATQLTAETPASSPMPAPAISPLHLVSHGEHPPMGSWCGIGLGTNGIGFDLRLSGGKLLRRVSFLSLTGRETVGAAFRGRGAFLVFLLRFRNTGTATYVSRVANGSKLVIQTQSGQAWLRAVGSVHLAPGPTVTLGYTDIQGPAHAGLMVLRPGQSETWQVAFAVTRERQQTTTPFVFVYQGPDTSLGLVWEVDKY